MGGGGGGTARGLFILAAFEMKLRALHMPGQAFFHCCSPRLTVSPWCPDSQSHCVAQTGREVSITAQGGLEFTSLLPFERSCSSARLGAVLLSFVRAESRGEQWVLKSCQRPGCHHRRHGEQGGAAGGALLVAFHNVVGGDISILGLPDTPG